MAALMHILFVSALLGCFLSQQIVAAEEDCEVCVGFLTKLVDTLSDSELKVPATIDAKIRETCLNAKNSENRFCYYVGGLDESATGILGEISKPLSWSMPPTKVCQKLKKKDSQICELRYEKQIDLSTVDLKKLKVRDLKKILSDWDESCNDCLEKSDFVKYIEKVKAKYVKTEL